MAPALFISSRTIASTFDVNEAGADVSYAKMYQAYRRIFERCGLKFRAVENFLLERCRNKLDPNPAVEYALAEIIRRPDQINLKRLNENIGYSQKHLIDMFKRQVGITPKAYLRIIRFQRAIREIEQRKAVSWTIISQDCGFYDQAHFINDFKSFSGFTPEEYVRSKNDVLNYVPVG